MGFTSEGWARLHYGPPCPAKLATVSFGSREIRCHPKAKRAFKRMRHVFKANNPHFFDLLDEGILNDWSFSCRKIAGSSSYSNHAFGLAVDWNANENYRGLPGLQSEMWRHMAESIELLEAEGVFHWGGRWSSPDSMHFEVALTPAELKARYTWTGRKKGRQHAWNGRKK